MLFDLSPVHTDEPNISFSSNNNCSSSKHPANKTNLQTNNTLPISNTCSNNLNISSLILSEHSYTVECGKKPKGKNSKAKKRCTVGTCNFTANSQF